MPSGKVHDWVTVGTAAASIPVVYTQVEPHYQPLTWLGIAAYTFSGIWLSSDLDLDSSAYRRWGPLRWIWWPYKKLVPHRSWISHGLGVGPLLRVLYLMAILYITAFLIVWGLGRLGISLDVDPNSWMSGIQSFFSTYRAELWAAGIGLIAGGAAHSILDFAHTRLKKWF